MKLRCGGTKEKHHFEDRGKLFGIHPFAHCDTDCPHMEGACEGHCSGRSIRQRPCLRKDYDEGNEIKRTKFSNPEEAARIIKEIDDLIRGGEILTDQQRHDYSFGKIFLNEIKKRRPKTE